MAEFLYATSHLAGDFDNPDNAVGNTPTTWAGALNTSDDDTSRWAMGNPSAALSGTQTIRVVARKGSNSGTPTIALNLYENGVLDSQILAATNITSTSGQTLTATFDASAIGNPADIEIEVVMAAAGGGPSARNSAQISHIELEANLATPTGTMAASQAAQTADLSGSLIFLGSVAASQAAQTADMAGSATGASEGTVDATQADQTADASGSLILPGIIDANQADQTADMSGALILSGAVAATQEDQVAAAAGQYSHSGAVDANQDDQTADLQGSLSIPGSVSAVQADQVMAAAGVVTNPNVAGILAATQDDQVAVFVGAVEVSGSVSAVQAGQVMAAAGVVPVRGLLVVVQAGQVGGFTATMTPNFPSSMDYGSVLRFRRSSRLTRF